MEKLFPGSFTTALGGTVIAVSILLSILSLIPCLKVQSTKLLALFVIVGLSLFANEWFTYFASVFVIATTVTEVEFLQNLAAIIRGDNKAYFDYKKESLSFEQRKNKIEKEEGNQFSELESVKADPTPDKNTAILKRPNLSRIIRIEEKALDKLEEYFNSKIERGVRVSRDGRHIELDGLIPSVVDDMVFEKIIEIKYLRNSNNNFLIKNLFPRIEQLARTYCQITNKIAKLYLVLVVEGDQELNKNQLQELKHLIDLSDIAMGYSVFTTKQLGIE